MSIDLLYKVAYDEAVRALSEQQSAIDNLRGRAGLLFSAAAITTSFLGAQALQGRNPNIASWLALLSFAVVAVASLAILWPRDWEVAANPRELIESYVESDGSISVEDFHRDLSLHMHRSYLENHEGLEQLTSFLKFSSSSLVLEVVLWIVAIAAGR